MMKNIFFRAASSAGLLTVVVTVAGAGHKFV